MDILERAYHRIIDMYDHYYEPEDSDTELTTSVMLYNLSCILQDLNPEEIELKYLITNILQYAKAPA